MKRADMEPGVLYAINARYNTRPGFVTDPGKPPGKVAVTVYMSWGERGEQDYLERDANVIVAGRSEECQVTTADVLKPWKQYVAERLAERQARTDERAAEEAECERKRLAYMARVEAVLPRLVGLDYAPGELAWAAKSGNMHDRRWSASDVLALIEHITHEEGQPS